MTYGHTQLRVRMAETEVQCVQNSAWQNLTTAMQWCHEAEGYLKGQEQVCLSHVQRLEGTGRTSQIFCM